MPALANLPTGLYRHHKGGWYQVLGTARCSETLQGMVVYRALGQQADQDWAATWVRPAAMFSETVNVAGQWQPRFTPINPATLPMADLPTARTLVAWFTRQAAEWGVHLRPPPPEPTTCCGRGCNGCVWEGFYSATHHWRSDAEAALQAGRKVFA